MCRWTSTRWTKRHKLICYYNDPLDQPGAEPPVAPMEWELFDLVADPMEVGNIYHAPAAAASEVLIRFELVSTVSDGLLGQFEAKGTTTGAYTEPIEQIAESVRIVARSSAGMLRSVGRSLLS